MAQIPPQDPALYAPSLLAEYRFDNGSGNILTDYANGFNGTLVNSPTWDSQGLNFSRSASQRVSLPPPLSNPGPSTVPNWGLQPLLGSDEPNGLYITGATNLGKQTIQFVGSRGQSNYSADNTWTALSYLGRGRQYVLAGCPIYRWPAHPPVCVPGRHAVPGSERLRDPRSTGMRTSSTGPRPPT
jgi:hypothetical protein